jgi:putative ABC transport system ATP-binding protein
MFGSSSSRPKAGYTPLDTAHLIELRKVTKTYTSAAGAFTAITSLDLSVDRGEFVAITGKSGSGKSTLINLIAGIDRATAGEVLVSGTAVHTLGENKVAIWRGRAIGVIFQFFQLLPTLTALENVVLPMELCGTYTSRVRRDHALRLLEQVELTDHAHKLPSALSGGQQQRVAIARALANDPPLLLADEPTGNLDSHTAESIVELFGQLVAQGKTIVMITHEADLAQRATRTITLADGQIVEEIENAKLKIEKETPVVVAPFSILNSQSSVSPEVDHV